MRRMSKAQLLFEMSKMYDRDPDAYKAKVLANMAQKAADKAAADKEAAHAQMVQHHQTQQMALQPSRMPGHVQTAPQPDPSSLGHTYTTHKETTGPRGAVHHASQVHFAPGPKLPGFTIAARGYEPKQPVYEPTEGTRPTVKSKREDPGGWGAGVQQKKYSEPAPITTTAKTKEGKDFHWQFGIGGDRASEIRRQLLAAQGKPEFSDIPYSPLTSSPFHQPAGHPAMMPYMPLSRIDFSKRGGTGPMIDPSTRGLMSPKEYADKGLTGGYSGLSAGGKIERTEYDPVLIKRLGSPAEERAKGHTTKYVGDYEPETPWERRLAGLGRKTEQPGMHREYVASDPVHTAMAMNPPVDPRHVQHPEVPGHFNVRHDITGGEHVLSFKGKGGGTHGLPLQDVLMQGSQLPRHPEMDPETHQQMMQYGHSMRMNIDSHLRELARQSMMKAGGGAPSPKVAYDSRTKHVFYHNPEGKVRAIHIDQVTPEMKQSKHMSGDVHREIKQLGAAIYHGRAHGGIGGKQYPKKNEGSATRVPRSVVVKELIGEVHA